MLATITAAGRTMAGRLVRHEDAGACVPENGHYCECLCEEVCNGGYCYLDCWEYRFDCHGVCYVSGYC